MACHLLDTTVLSNFAHVRRPALVRKALGDAVFTTPVVLSELSQGESAGFVPVCDWSWLQVIAADDEAHTLASDLQSILDPGEAESLAVAIRRQCVFLSDDFAARRIARERGVTVSGTLGILIKLVRAAYLSLDEADTLLQRMMAQGYRSPVATLADLQLF